MGRGWADDPTDKVPESRFVADMAVHICNPRTTSGDRQIHGAQWHVCHVYMNKLTIYRDIMHMQKKKISRTNFSKIKR